MYQKPSEELIKQLRDAEAQHAAGALQEAAELYRMVLGRYPEFALARTAYNLGIVLNDLQQYADAEAAFRQALAMQPDFPEAGLNLCFAMQEQGRFVEAIEGYGRLASSPCTSTDARFNLACLQLLCGDLIHGWEGYELRFETLHPVARRHSSIPSWNGIMSPGIRLLIHTEQGYGDAIQMVRYLPVLAGYGIDVHLETSSTLAPLLSNTSGLKSCFVRGAEVPEVDFQVPIMSLPGLMATTLESIPGSVPYLIAKDDKICFWRKQLPASSRLRVGLAWAGRLDLPVNRKRSIFPALLGPLLEIPDLLFVSLLKEVPDDYGTSDPRIHSYSGHQHDFHDTAALIANLDLVITIDTAVAHLSGAMGIPTWLLLPFVPDWRWLLDSNSSPWYPTMRLFRQNALGDWGAVIVQVQLELQQLLHPTFFCYKPGRDFLSPPHLADRLIPLLKDAGGGLAEGVPGTVTTDFAQANLVLFPYYLEHLTEHISIAGMRSFITALPFFRDGEERHVFFTDHDSPALYHTRAYWCRASVNAANHDDVTLALPYHTEDLISYLHFDPEAITCHTSFVGYIGTRRERAALLNGIIKEKRLVSLFDAVDSFHGHQSEEVRQQRRALYLEVMAKSLTVLCPEGAGVNSIRFFEALSMGRIPVLISNALLPYHDRIDYDRFIIRIDPALQGDAGEILFAWLERRTGEDIMACCRLARATWEQWFSPKNMGRALSGALIRKRLKRGRLSLSSPDDPSEVPSAVSGGDHPMKSFLSCLEQDDLSAAEGSLSKVLREDPCNPILYNMRGFLALRVGDIEAAERSFLEALQYDHRCYEAYMELGALYHGSGRDEEAAARYFEAGLVRPNCPEPFLSVIPSLIRLGRHQEVAYCCREVQRLGGNVPDVSLIERRLLNPLYAIPGIDK